MAVVEHASCENDLEPRDDGRQLVNEEKVEAGDRWRAGERTANKARQGAGVLERSDGKDELEGERELLQNG